eukprot:239747-Prymnesium_polylepis.1
MAVSRAAFGVRSRTRRPAKTPPPAAAPPRCTRPGASHRSSRCSASRPHPSQRACVCPLVVGAPRAHLAMPSALRFRCTTRPAPLSISATACEPHSCGTFAPRSRVITERHASTKWRRTAKAS